MERCGFFDAYLNGTEYDRVYLAAQFAAYFASFIGNGVYAQHGNQLQVIQQSAADMSIQVLSGQGWINGYWYENSDSLTIPIEVADGVLNRIDSIVLRLGFSERNMWLAIKKGTPANVPSPPALTRNSDYYELQLAEISIPAGSIHVTQAQITDTRMNANICGWVTGVVDQIDTTTLFNQFETYFTEFKEMNEAEFESWTEEQKNEYLTWISTQEGNFENWYNSHTESWQTQFNTWFQSIQDQLSGDIAGQLQNEIDEVNEKLDGYTSGTTVFSSDGKTITQQLQSGETLVTTFVDNFTIVQEWFNGSVKVKRKKITFSVDGTTINEVKEEI